MYNRGCVTPKSNCPQIAKPGRGRARVSDHTLPYHSFTHTPAEVSDQATWPRKEVSTESGKIQKQKIKTRAFPHHLTYSSNPWRSSLLAGDILMPNKGDVSAFTVEELKGLKAAFSASPSLAVITCVSRQHFHKQLRSPKWNGLGSRYQSYQKVCGFRPHPYIKASWKQGIPHLG